MWNVTRKFASRSGATSLLRLESYTTAYRWGDRVQLILSSVLVDTLFNITLVFNVVINFIKCKAAEVVGFICIFYWSVIYYPLSPIDHSIILLEALEALVYKDLFLHDQLYNNWINNLLILEYLWFVNSSSCRIR